jgi:hypothetical protein
MEHPDLKILIQRAIHEDRIREGQRERQVSRAAAISPVRVLTGKILIDLGTRIAARPRPIGGAPLMGEISLAGRADS